MKLATCLLFAAGLIFASNSATAAVPGDKIVYKDVIVPILEAKCIGCHGEEKTKGKLRLDSHEAILKGGSDGDGVIPGKLDESNLWFRIDLPKDDDDVMPPEDEEPLTKEETALIKWWIESGAKPDQKVADAKPSAELQKSMEVVLAAAAKAPSKPAEPAKPAVDPKVAEARAKAAAETIGRVEAAGASLQAIAQDTPDLRFSALNVAKDFKDEGLNLLKPVADQVQWVDLARTQVTDKGLAAVASMKNLTRLHLENTSITDAGLDHLKGLSKLEYLNLYGTQVSDAGLQKLAGLKNLKKLYVWQTKVTDKGAEALAAKIPGLDANTGWKASAPPVEVAAAKPAAPAPTEDKKPATPAPAKPATPPAKPDPKATPKPDAPKPTPDPKKPDAPKPTTPAPAKPAPTKADTPKPTPTPTTPAGKPDAPKPTPTPKPAPAKPAPAKPAPAANPDAELIANLASEAQKAADAAQLAADNAVKAAQEAQKAADHLKKAADAMK